jgi:uncharacterized membrane protein (DUF373 family)
MGERTDEAAGHPLVGRGDRMWTELLERGDQLIYIVVGIGFLLAAAFSLVYAVATFVINLAALTPVGVFGGQVRGHSAVEAIITFVSDLLLTLIIMEVMGTVVGYLRSRATSLKPFLFIGIISATRGILAVGARLSVAGTSVDETAFRDAMIELAVNAAVIIALGITLRLIGRYLEEAPPGERQAPENVV